jgi:hypothetical protein
LQVIHEALLTPELVASYERLGKFRTEARVDEHQVVSGLD